MTSDECATILTGLAAAFPASPQREGTADVWRKHLTPLDFDVADRAVGQCIDNLKFFPSIAEFREFYRLERHNQPIARKPPPDPPGEIPTWVHVWEWRRRQTLTARQAARESGVPVEERVPVKMRCFPQFAHLEPGAPAYSVEEYDQLERAWVAAGSPSIGDVGELLAGVGHAA